MPLGDLDGAVHPAGGVEVHAMVVEGGWHVERVGHMEEERVGRIDRECGGSVGASACTVGVQGPVRPGVVDANNAARVEAVRVGVLDVGDGPPALLHAGEDGGDDEGEGKKQRTGHGVGKFSRTSVI